MVNRVLDALLPPSPGLESKNDKNDSSMNTRQKFRKKERRKLDEKEIEIEIQATCWNRDNKASWYGRNDQSITRNVPDPI